MIVREALISDIQQLHAIRMSVKENALSNPSLVTEHDYINFLTARGKGWLAEANNYALGFAIIDLLEHNIWALFVDPGHEGIGIGKKLHNTMLNWYFARYTEELWLSTAPDTRAEKFYGLLGWKDDGRRKNGETRFTMAASDWMAARAK